MEKFHQQGIRSHGPEFHRRGRLVETGKESLEWPSDKKCRVMRGLTRARANRASHSGRHRGTVGNYYGMELV